MALNRVSCRTRRRFGCALLAIGLLVPGCASDRNGQRFTGEIQSLLTRDLAWARAASGDDVESILDFWTADAVIYPQGMPPVQGKEAIRAFVIQRRAMPGFDISWAPQRAGLLGRNQGFTAGRHTGTMENSAGELVTLKGHYMCLWRKEKDRWRCFLECWNASPEESVQRADLTHSR